MPDTPVFAVDYETYYDSDYSLKKIPTWSYVFDERFDSYLVSVASDTGVLWVGHPRDFDWSLLNGVTVLHHNASFDALVTRRLQQDGVIPEFQPAEIQDTADLAAYLQCPRALKDYARFVWGLEGAAAAGKAARAKMQGLPAAQLMHDQEILDYATMDAKLTLRLWQESAHLWPESERELSRLNRESGWRGVQIDMDYANRCCDMLALKLFEAGRLIPWDWSTRKTPLSPKQIEKWAAQENIALRKEWFERMGVHGDGVDEADIPKIWLPSSYAQDSVECAKWEAEYGDTYAWIGAIRDWRKLNTLYNKFVHLRDRTDENGVFHFQKKYFGAARTGRFSGDGRFNMENLPRDELFCDLGPDGTPVPGTGVDLRRCIMGNLGVVDYRQVEARILLALVKDEKALDQVRRKGRSVYEAHAVATMDWPEDQPMDKKSTQYRLAKARVLALGYACGPARFRDAARIMAGLELTDEDAASAVADYRASNPRVTKFWYRLNDQLRDAVARRDPVFTVKLPSGRPLRYWVPRIRRAKDKKTGEIREDMVSMTAKGVTSSYRRIYGANVVENICQAVCRDLIRDAWIELERRGYRVLFTVHDEFVLDLQPGQTIEEAAEIIKAPPAWATFIPLDVEYHTHHNFSKAEGE